MSVTITILRTADGSKSRVDLPLSSTLNALKDGISGSTLGPINREHQRLFHLGRELKSGGRSLAGLGVGKHENFIVHLHSTQPETFELSSDDEDSDVVIEEVVPSAQRSSGEKRVREASSAASVARRRRVVDLYEDSDDDDDDVAIVEPIPSTGATKKRK